MAKPFEVEQDQGRAVPAREPPELLVDRRRGGRRRAGFLAGRPPRSAPALVRSRPFRRAATARARRATRSATPWSQGPSDPPTRTAPARRARTRNVAWKASPASAESRRPPADAPDHRPVPVHQRREGQLGGLVASRRRTGRAIARPSGPPSPRPRPAGEVPQSPAGPPIRHRHLRLPSRRRPSTHVMHPEGVGIPLFSGRADFPASAQFATWAVFTIPGKRHGSDSATAPGPDPDGAPPGDLAVLLEDADVVPAQPVGPLLLVEATRTRPSPSRARPSRRGRNP